jgi:hypothetical protein
MLPLHHKPFILSFRITPDYYPKVETHSLPKMQTVKPTLKPLGKRKRNKTLNSYYFSKKELIRKEGLAIYRALPQDLKNEVDKWYGKMFTAPLLKKVFAASWNNEPFVSLKKVIETFSYLTENQKPTIDYCTTINKTLQVLLFKPNECRLKKNRDPFSRNEWSITYEFFTIEKYWNGFEYRQNYSVNVVSLLQNFNKT